MFRSNAFLWILAIALAIQVYVSFSTPIGGSFSDAVTLAMNGVQPVTPVRGTVIASDANGTIHLNDLYNEAGAIHTNRPFNAQVGDIVVVNIAYNTRTKVFDLVDLVRVNPLITFPMIQGLGELGRNILFHVPMAMVAFIAFFIGTVYSILYLIKKNPDYDRHARASSAAGTLFTILATVTGSIWARFSWGTFWNWDPRETSIFILLLIYAAYFMLRSLLEESEDKKARIAAVYNIIAFVSVPFLMFVVPRITQSLHPGGGGTEAPVLNLSGTTHTDRTLLNMHWISVILFLLVFLWMKDLYTRILRMEDHRAELLDTD